MTVELALIGFLVMRLHDKGIFDWEDIIACFVLIILVCLIEGVFKGLLKKIKQEEIQ